MDRLRNYEISFSGLKNGKHIFRFDLDKAFFKLFETEQEFDNPKINATVVLEKHTTFLELTIDVNGEVELVCDITSDIFDEKIENQMQFLVKFGEKYDDSDENVITIPMNDHQFNVAQQLYESVVLAIPMKKISPKVTDEDLEILEKYSPKETQEEEEEEETQSDPRWDALKKLKDKN